MAEHPLEAADQEFAELQAQKSKKATKAIGPKADKGTTNKPRIPSAEELAKYEKEAGVEKLITKSEPNTVMGAGAKEIDLSTIAAGTPMSQGMTQPDNHLRPKIHRLLGQEGHAKVYAAATGRSEQEWHDMPDDQKHGWQKSPEGSNATSAAVKTAEANYVQTNNARDKEKSVLLSRVRGAFFPSPEAKTAFEERGELPRSGNIEDVVDARDPIQRAALGMPRTEPENNWRNTWTVNVRPDSRVGGVENVKGLALHQDPSHFEAMESHINDLTTRPLHGDLRMSRNPAGLPTLASQSGMRSIPVRQSSSDQIGDRFPGSHGKTILRQDQFDTRGMEGLHAREALAKAAKAHSIGDHSAALRYFSQANEHAATLANITNEANRTRGADVGKFADADEDRGDKIMSGYRQSIEHRR
jgi:hypothetical protein